MRGTMTASIVVDITRLPEVIAGLRVEMAELLREASQDESPVVASRLRALAAQFETGVTL
jgi:hypothetical protein